MTKPRPFGHYFILEKIAQGGMAEIFKGLTYDFSGLKKFIVIKRILPHIAANQDFIRMLVDEAKIAVRLNHGNIAQTFDLGKVAEDYFIVMEYVEGRTVSQVFKKSVLLKEFLPIPIVTYLTAEICNGLDYIHRRSDENGNPLGIVHCDISPQNVIISPSGNVKIVDFGVAKAAFKLSEKERGVLKGKFAYMSPEQTEGVYVDARSDIFSTGVLLWEALTGRRLFKKKNNSETIEAVNQMTVYPPSAYRNEIPSELDDIVLCALARDPEKRFESAADMSLALTKFNLKHYPEFKSIQIADLLNHLFEDEENTADFYQEKTQHEEVTFLEGDSKKEEEGEEKTPAENTVILDPQELDFHSLFDEIEVDEVSEVTQAIHILPGEQTAAPKEDEPTGDLPPEEIPEEASPQQISRQQFKKKGLIALGVILGVLFIYLIVAHSLQSSPDKGQNPTQRGVAPGEIVLSSEPPGARVFIDNQATEKLTPLKLATKDLSFPLILGLAQGDSVEWTQHIENPPENTLEIHADLTQPFALVDLYTSPPGAQLEINGEVIGTTPLYSVRIRADRELQLSLKLSGYREVQDQINLAEEGRESLHWDLEEISPR